MTREEAKNKIAEECGTSVCNNREGVSYCGLRGFLFGLNLIGTDRSQRSRKTGFFFYSNESLENFQSVMGPWLQSKLRQYGFSEEECRVRTNRSNNVEGHIADFYLDVDWASLTKQGIDEIKSLYDRLVEFQNRYWPANDKDRNSEIRTYNEMNRDEINEYVRRRCNEEIQLDGDDGYDNGGFVMPNSVNEIKQLVESNYQVILTGAPGTGKTYTARKVALEITGEDEGTPEEESRIKVVQFHPGYDYSDFVIGMKPVLVTENGKEVFKDEQGRLYTTNNNEADGQRQDFSGKVCVSYVWRDGVFKEFANRAKEAYDTYPADPQKFVFLIDEINRADLSRVFGELFSLFEEDYRYPTNRKGIILPNGEEFVIPKNLYIIGTMNDIDRSVESMDFALRRRFAWYEVSADKSERIIEDKIDDAETKRKLLSAMRKVNEIIADPNSRLGKEYQLGGAIFAKYPKYHGEDDSFNNLWNNHIAVILNEYLRGRRDKESKLEALKNAYDEGMRSQNGVGAN